MEFDAKALMDKIANYRGVIITDSINIEAFISSIIINYFVRSDKHSEFLTKVIEDENFSFGLKINVLDKLNLEYYPEFIQDLRRINRIRNAFAHALPSLDGSLSVYNKDKRIHEYKKLEELHREFLEKIQKVDAQLREIFWKLVESAKKA